MAMPVRCALADDARTGLKNQATSKSVKDYYCNSKSTPKPNHDKCKETETIHCLLRASVSKY